MKAFIQSALILTFSVGALNTFYAGSATWSANPLNGDWNNPANWIPQTVPNGPSDVATFSAQPRTSSQTEISLSASVVVAEIAFDTDANSYKITCAAGTSLTFAGFGIRNRTARDGPPQIFTVAPAESVGGNPGALIFTGESAARGITIINNGGTASGVAGGTTTFQDSSGGGANLIANGGTNGGAGGIIQFLDHAIGEKAAVETHGNGTLLVDSSSSVTELNSISGDGQVILNNTVHINGGVGTFSGIISGSGGLLIGQGSETLTGASIYSGNTWVQFGTLIVSNTTGSGTGSGDVLVSRALLGGNGIIAGNVTLDKGFGFPFIDPVGTLTIGKRLKFGLRGGYLCLVDGGTGSSDLLSANSVIIDPTATLYLDENGTAPVGTTFTIIERRGTGPIIGTFMNLPDGGTITADNNTFQANYEGGDGNDLTLTVVP
jgi:hypothetical protein